MKITIEMEFGKETGTIIGLLQEQIRSLENGLDLLSENHKSTAMFAIEVGKRMIKQIETKIKYSLFS